MSASWCQGAKMVDFGVSLQSREKGPVNPNGLAREFWYQDTGYPVHRCVCVSVSMCISVSRGVPECISGVKIVTFGVPLDL